VRAIRPVAAPLVAASLLGVALLAGRPALAQRIHLQAVATAELGEDFTCMGMSHRDPNVVVVGTSTGKVVRTEDGGATWQLYTVTPSRTLFFGRERSPDPRMDYALGLPGKSPHLQRWIRQKGLQTSGINLQQLLVQKGDKMVSVNWIEEDWHDPKTLYIGTVDGLYRSRDRGRTFIRIFQGWNTMSERMVNTVATDPADPRRLILGTASGLFTSQDGGMNYQKTMNYYMRDSYFREIWFDPQQPGLVHVAMGGSAMASPDGGRNWITTHWDEWGPRADVTSISLGPQNLRLIGTRDGLFASWQGGEMGSWTRRGFRFVGTTMTKVLATADPSVWFALTDEALWGTTDSGLNWFKVFQFGAREAPRWLAAHNGDIRHLWVLTNRSIYRVGPPARLASAPSVPRAPRRLLDVPNLHTFHVEVLKHNGLHFPVIQRYRDRGPWAALLPNITVGSHWARAVDWMVYKDWMMQAWPYRYYNWAVDNGITWEVFAHWELGRLIFDKRELPHWGRVDRNLSAARQDLAERVHRLYMEYLKVARILVDNPPADLMVRRFHEIRLKEIIAYFDAISGGYWSKKTGGLP
jgi:photosystem II stability/assembly factor-like uncharacterized protein